MNRKILLLGITVLLCLLFSSISYAGSTDVKNKEWVVTLRPETKISSINDYVSKLAELFDRLRYYDVYPGGFQYTNMSNDLEISFKASSSQSFKVSDFTSLGRINHIIVSEYTEKKIKNSKKYIPVGTPILDSKDVLNTFDNSSEDKPVTLMLTKNSADKIKDLIEKNSDKKYGIFSDGKYILDLNLKGCRISGEYFDIVIKDKYKAKITGKLFNSGMLPIKLKVVKVKKMVVKNHSDFTN